MKRNEGKFWFTKKFPYDIEMLLDDHPYPLKQIIFYHLLYTWKEQAPMSHWSLLKNPDWWFGQYG